MSKTVRRAYLIDTTFNSIQRVLVDSTSSLNAPMIFRPGDAWSFGLREHEHLKFMPGVLKYNDWYDGWWTSNWQECPDWVWCYGISPHGEVRKSFWV